MTGDTSATTGQLAPTQSPFRGAVRQNGYVVRDIDREIEHWVQLGVGPWFKLSVPGFDTRYRGTVVRPDLVIAFANSGELQIELIQQLDDGPSIYREFLDAGREGFHHLAWWVDDYAGFVADAAASGWTEVYGGDNSGTTNFCYFDSRANSSTCLEVMELNDMTRWLNNRVRDASLDWDGNEAIRSL